MTAVNVKFFLAYILAVCRVGCAYEGFEDAVYKDKRCACISYYEPKDFLEPKKLAPLRPVDTPSEAPQTEPRTSIPIFDIGFDSNS